MKSILVLETQKYPEDFLAILSARTPYSPIKLVVVGDDDLPKTKLLLMYSRGEIPISYVPTVFENFSHRIDFEDNFLIVSLWDTSGQEQYDRLRPLSYSNADIILILFDINRRKTFDNVNSKWGDEIRHYCDDVECILVGIHGEGENCLSDESDKQCVTEEEGKECAQRFGARKYVQIHLNEKESINKLFEDAAIYGLLYNYKYKKHLKTDD